MTSLFGLNWPIEIIPDETVPENEIQLRQNGRIVGRIIDDREIVIEHPEIKVEDNQVLITGSGRFLSETERRTRRKETALFFIEAEIAKATQSNQNLDQPILQELMKKIEKILESVY